MTMSDATLQLDRQNRYAVKALLASLAGNILDTFDNLLLGFPSRCDLLRITTLPLRSWFYRNRNVDRGGGRRNCIRQLVRLLRQSSGPCLDDHRLCSLHGALCVFRRLLGPSGLSHGSGPRHRWRVGHRYGSGGGSVASPNTRKGSVVRRHRRPAWGAACRVCDANSSPAHRLARCVRRRGLPGHPGVRAAPHAR